MAASDSFRMTEDKYRFVLLRERRAKCQGNVQGRKARGIMRRIRGGAQTGHSH